MVHSKSRKLGHRRSDVPNPGCVCLGSSTPGEVRWREASKTNHKRTTCVCLLHAFRSYSGCSLPYSIMLGHQKHDQEFEDGCYPATGVTFQSFKVKKRKRSRLRRFSLLRLLRFDCALYFERKRMGREASLACYYSSQLQGRFGHTERNTGRSSMPSTSKLILWSKFASTKPLEVWVANFLFFFFFADLPCHGTGRIWLQG